MTKTMLFLLLASTPLHAQNWPQFRGPGARGIAEGIETPVEWSVTEGRNVLFRVPVQGLGHSSPVIWGDQIFLTTAVSAAGDPRLRVGLYGDISPVEGEGAQSFRVLSFDKTTGRLLWEKTAYEGVPRIKRHPKSTHANPTPATDGNVLVVFFGSEGLYGYDLAGNLLWKRDFGVLRAGFFQAPDAEWGFASSPVIHDGKVIIQADVLGESFLEVLSVDDGRTLWKISRDDVPTWSTPNIYRGPRGDSVVLNGFKHIGGYELTTGRPIWKMSGGGDIPVPTPVVAGELIFITNAHGPGSPIYVVPTSAEGELTPGDLPWSIETGGAYMQTPLVLEAVLYSCRDNGVLSAFEAKTGKLLYRERLGGGDNGFSASPIAAGGKLYFTSEEGDVHVLRPGAEFEVLAVNSLGEVTMATPAASEGALFFRTRGHLVALGAKPSTTP
ncbi:MAG TPA: PQQ-binding-like beta-propeller repeat protein [Vicinamibacteria bacterium]|nr:PQQ-binding-like beta-propeller repeat protein [Vicinamibacteria bacterium]